MHGLRIKRLLLVALALSAGGCASYVTPGGPVALGAIDDTGIEEAFSRQPASPLPANVAVVRVQDAGYRSRTYSGLNLGRFTVVTTRDIESDAALEELRSLPMLSGMAPLSTLLLPGAAGSIRDLRIPAARLQADMLLIYTVNTAFTVDGTPLGPLSVVSLGFLPNHKAHVTATVSGILVDVRTGFVYGAAEASATEHQRASVWSTGLVTDRARLSAEQSAFEDFAGSFADLWGTIVQARATPVAPGTPYFVQKP